MRRNMRRGFTLVEALVYVAILGIFSLLVAQLFITYPKLSRKMAWKMDIIKLARILDVKLAGTFDAINDGVNPPYQLIMSGNCVVSNNPPVSRCVQVRTVDEETFWQDPANVPPSAYRYVTYYYDQAARQLVRDPDGTPNSGDETVLLSANVGDGGMFVRTLRDVHFSVMSSGLQSIQGNYLNIYVSIDAPSQAVAGGTITLRTVIASSSPF